MKRPPFLNGKLYHIFNRGVEKRNIYLDERDYFRFLASIKDFNDVNSSINLYRRVNVGYPISHKKEPLVKVICYCLMPNHFHFILKQIKNKSISKFLQKLGIGYTNYFNQKYNRSGVLFQGKFKAALVDKESYLNYLMQYIYLNPLDIIEPGWKDGGLKNWSKAKKFLKSYKWTSCKDYDQYDEIFIDNIPERFSGIDKYIIE